MEAKLKIRNNAETEVGGEVTVVATEGFQVSPALGWTDSVVSSQTTCLRTKLLKSTEL
jgi:hypothetical protein